MSNTRTLRVSIVCLSGVHLCSLVVRSIMVATRDVVLSLLKRFPRALGKTELIKLVYLIDCEYYRLHGETMTGLTYWRDQYGPVNYAITDAAIELASRGLVSIVPSATPAGHVRYEHSLTSLGEDVVPELRPHQEWVINVVVSLTKALRSDEIIQLAYQTPPMRHIIELENNAGQGLKGEEVPMSELRSFKPRFSRKRLVAQLRSMDLTPKPMTEKALQQSRELEEEFRVYRERAWNVFTKSSHS